MRHDFGRSKQEVTLSLANERIKCIKREDVQWLGKRPNNHHGGASATFAPGPRSERISCYSERAEASDTGMSLRVGQPTRYIAFSEC